MVCVKVTGGVHPSAPTDMHATIKDIVGNDVFHKGCAQAI
jgi:hypothetical protein